MSRSANRNQKAKLAADYNDLLKELSSHKITTVGCYTVGDTIGEGSYGKVKLGIHKLTGQRVAIKKIDKQHAPLMAREIHHHRQLRHPNIVTLHEVVLTESAIHVVSEYCPNGELFDALTSCGRFSEAQAQRTFLQLVDAIRCCHANGIVHRDLKLENILLDVDYNAKICDFGFARHAEHNQVLETFCGSLGYSAPEVIMRQKHTGPETDIWSLGIILYTLLAGELPFDDDIESLMQRKIVDVDYHIPSYFSPEVSDLISRILKRNPTERLSIDDIVEHPWSRMSHDDEDEDYASTRNSSHSDIDSIFSSPVHEEDEDEVATEATSHDSYISLSDTKPIPLGRFPVETAKFSPQVRCSLGMMRPEEKSRSQPRSPRFSAPTVGSRTSISPPASPCRSSLPLSLSMMHRSSDESFMAPNEQRLMSTLLAAGFDESVVRNMRFNSCGTSNTLWHMLLDKVDKEGNSKRGVEPFGSTRSVSSTKTSLKPYSGQCSPSCTDRATQTDSVLAGVNEGIQTCHAASAPPPPPLKRLAPPARSIPPPIQISSTKLAAPPTGDRGERSGWFSSVRSWFSKQDDRPGELSTPRTATSFRGPPTASRRPPVLQTPTYRDFDRPKMVDDETQSSTLTPPIYRSGSVKYRRRMLQLTNPPVSELDQLTYHSTTAPIRPAMPPLSARLPSEKRSIPRLSTNFVPVATPPNAALASPRVADTLSIVTSPAYLSPLASPSAPLTAVPREVKEVDMCTRRYSQLRPLPLDRPPSPPVERPLPQRPFICTTPTLERVPSHDSLPTPESEEDKPMPVPASQPVLASVPVPVPAPVPVMNNARSVEVEVDMDMDDGDSRSSLSEAESDELVDVAINGKDMSMPSPYQFNRVISLPTPESSPSPPPMMRPAPASPMTLKAPVTRRFEFTPRPRLSVYGMGDRSNMGGRAIIEEEEEEEG